MHIEKEKKVFRSVTLRLDTKKEVDLFYHMIDCAFGKSLDQYCRENEMVEADEMEKFGMEIWGLLRKVYERDC